MTEAGRTPSFDQIDKSVGDEMPAADLVATGEGVASAGPDIAAVDAAVEASAHWPEPHPRLRRFFEDMSNSGAFRRTGRWER